MTASIIVQLATFASISLYLDDPQPYACMLQEVRDYKAQEHYLEVVVLGDDVFNIVVGE